MSSALASWDAGILPRPFVVRDWREELPDTASLTLAPVGGGAVSFQPGQFTMLSRPGIGEIPISISGDPRDETGLVHTIRAVGAVSGALSDLRPGDHVGVRGPFGTGWPVAEARGRQLLVIAGGLGLAPTRPIILRALQNADAHAGISLLYGAREPEAVLYGDMLETWANDSRISVSVTVDRAGPDWRGRVGVVPDLIRGLEVDPATVTAMVCGPEVMMRFTLRALRAIGVPDDQVFVSLERNMQCGIGWCGHCQIGPVLVCRDGPVFSARDVAPLMAVWEL